MDVVAILRRSGGLDALARQLGEKPPQVYAGATAMMPGLIDAMRAQVQALGGSRIGVNRLVTMFENYGNGKLAEDVMAPGKVDPAPGLELLGIMFGPEGALSLAAGEPARASGVEAALLEAMLPLLTMLTCGYFSAMAIGNAAVAPQGGTGFGAIVELLTAQA
ncbi:MAG: hypothetical protein KDE55_12445 [Novosphingobium sp.]|nr:hypothetical protein [Novosphingobium sp.]